MHIMRERLLPRTMAWALITSMSLYPSLARAGQDPAAEPIGGYLGLGPVKYTGDFPFYFQEEIERTIATALDRAGAAPLQAQPGECEQLECIRQAATQAGVHVVLVSSLLHENRDYQAEFIAYAVDDGRVLAQTIVECSICGQQELLDAIPAKLIELEAKVAQVFAAQMWPARVAVDGAPTHASLTLDGQQIGSSPMTLVVEPGAHQLEITADGYATQHYHWTAVDNVEEHIEYTLTPALDTRGLHSGGWVALSLGVATTGAGITLAALDGRNHNPSCGPQLRDPNGGCPNIYATATAGYLILGVGVAALATGVGLLIRHHQGKPKPSSARVGFTTHGLGLRF